MDKIPVPINLPGAKVIDVKTDKYNQIFIKIETTETKVKCRICKKEINKRHGSDKEIKLKHLPSFGNNVFIIYSPNRYICKDCKDHPTTTATPFWHNKNSSFTKAYEQFVLLELINSTIIDVSKKLNLTEKLVQGTLDRYIAAEIDWKTISKLGVLGLDEISLKKGHKGFLTIITYRINKETHLLAVLEGRKRAAIQAFLRRIPKRLAKTIDAVCVDMYDGYINAIKAVFKNKVLIVIDRFHVAKLYRKSLDKFRQKVIKELKQTLSVREYEKIIGATKILRKSNECLTKKEKEIVDTLFSYSPELMEAYFKTIQLTQIFNSHLSKEEGLEKITEWIELVQKSNLTCFDTFLKTFKKWKNEIANYFVARLNSGFVEGFNNKVKVLKRRCYGIFNIKHFFQRLFLDVSGYELLLGKSAC
ncbi:MAG: ISL3 family transposase [archaeon]|nr:ISL3 family transposase [archaeon]